MPQKKKIISTKNQFSRLVIIVNPMSTNIQLAKRRIKELQSFFAKDKITIIETVSDGREANEKLIQKNANLLGEETLLCIAGGDGTVNMVLTALLTKKMPQKALKTTVLPLWGGNANDLAYMLNGFSFRIKLQTLLNKAELICIYPLECNITLPNNSVLTRVAASYVSFGATAFAARRLNESSHRKSWLLKIPGGRFLQEIKTILLALIEAPTFTVKENGKTEAIYERIFANGPRMAKIESFPGRLTDGSFYRTTFEHKHISAVILRIAELIRGRRIEKIKNNKLKFTTGEVVWAQFDGEVLEVPAGSKITLRISDVPFYALSMISTRERSKSKNVS